MTKKVSFSVERTVSPSHSNYDSTDVEKGVESGNGVMSRLHRRRRGSSLISKIPTEAESLTVLVGGVNFLKQTITVFVRLEEVSLRNPLTLHFGSKFG